MEITKEEALVILEAFGNIERFAGNTIGEENLESRIRKEFSKYKRVANYDYEQQAKKYGW